MVGDLVGHRAQQKALCAGHPLVADDDQIGLPLFCDVEHGVRRIALARVDVDRHPGRASDRRRRLQRGVHVLAGVDRPLQVLGSLSTFLAQPLRRNRLVRAPQLELRAPPAREVGRLAHRLGGGVRAVSSNDDRLEQQDPPCPPCPCPLSSTAEPRSQGADHIRLARKSLSPKTSRDMRLCAYGSRTVIDLHCHVLPGIDDGPQTIDDSVALAAAAATAGMRTLVATPHVSSRYQNDPDTIAQLVAELNTRLAAEGIAVDVTAGAEIAMTR